MGKWWEAGAGIDGQMVSTGLPEQSRKMEIKFSCKKKKTKSTRLQLVNWGLKPLCVEALLIWGVTP